MDLVSRVTTSRTKQRWAFRLPNDETQTYRPVLPQGGLYSSEVLGLQLGIERNKLRYYLDTAPLPYSNELIQRLNASFDELAAKLEQETARAQKEAARADVAEARLAEALAEIERLKNSGN